MTDGVIKGTGNSRYLKSVSNFLTLYPTYTDMVKALVAGTLPIDLNGINTAGWSTQGTKLNKANLLSSSTETAIWGSSGNRTVDAALAKIGPIAISAQDTATTAKNKIITGSMASTSGYVQVSTPSKPVLTIQTCYYINSSGTKNGAQLFIRTPDLNIYTESYENVGNMMQNYIYFEASTNSNIFNNNKASFGGVTTGGTIYYIIICE